MKMMPAQKPGRSKQDYGTPLGFIRVVEARYGDLAFDLAAHAGNTKCEKYFTPEDDSLKQDWGALEGNLWLNPPFEHIAPWAKKCAETCIRDRILFLVPASVGSNWFAEYVNGRAYVHALQGRLSFDGKNPYPKDCILAIYDGLSHMDGNFDVWDWRK